MSTFIAVWNPAKSLQHLHFELNIWQVTEFKLYRIFTWRSVYWSDKSGILVSETYQLHSKLTLDCSLGFNVYLSCMDEVYSKHNFRGQLIFFCFSCTGGKLKERTSHSFNPIKCSKCHSQYKKERPAKKTLLHIN